MRRIALSFFILITGWSGYSQSVRQTEADTYTRYELLEPETSRFRILYDVSATTEGARFYFNTLRRGSDHEVHAVYDLLSGEKLQWAIVDGAVARQEGHPAANPETDYLKVLLPRPVPQGGEVRLRIDKTYRDTASYYRRDDYIVFDRSLSIPRNAVVLPAGYELLRCNYPSQVARESDGRLRISFMNRGPGAVPFRVEARPLPASARVSPPASDSRPWPDTPGQPSGPDRSRARLDYAPEERAFQDREIVYFLQQPETHSFRLYHDYTETRAGVDKYLNVVRAGSKASDPEAFALDTGRKLRVATLRGEEITHEGIDLGQPVTPQTEVVVIWFDPVQPGRSTRLRIWETYTDPNRYLLYNGELIWDRSFGRPRNSVVLPEGWYLTDNDIPAVIDSTDDGRLRLYYENDRPGNIDVFIRARKR